jgi:lactate dehydrogenase-like 2-hydroxyacid dehydrogenase
MTMPDSLTDARRAAATQHGPVLVLSRLAPPQIAEALAGGFTCLNAFETPGLDALIAAHGAEIRALVTTGGRGAEAALIARLPALEIVSVFGVGIDAVDLTAAAARGIAVTNTPDVLTDDVADFAVALYLSAIRLVTAGDRAIRAGAWDRPLAMPLSARGRKVGILGLGRIGKAIARLMEAFGAEIAYCKSRPDADVPYRFEPNPVALARSSEVLFVATPGGAATRGLVGREVIEALGAQGLLINIARGSVVDEPTLIAALEDGRLGAAALDVFATEPQVPDRLRSLDNVVLTPHIGSFTQETRTAMGQLVLDNLAAHFAGRPLLTPVG